MADNGLKTIVDNKVRNYRELNRVALKHQTVLAGSSLMDYFPVNELLMNISSDRKVYNRGILSLTIAQYREVIDVVTDLEPSRLFINIGTNDLTRGGDTIGNLIRNYRQLLVLIRERVPQCQITLMAYYPCREVTQPETREGRIARTNENIRKANVEVAKLADELGLGFIDITGPLYDDKGELRQELCLDPVHFSAEGYIEVFGLLEKFL